MTRQLVEMSASFWLDDGDDMGDMIEEAADFVTSVLPGTDITVTVDRVDAGYYSDWLERRIESGRR